jgi:hypothetical protein
MVEPQGCPALGKGLGKSNFGRLKLNNYQAPILVLSDAISRARMQIAGIVADSKAKMELYDPQCIGYGHIIGAEPHWQYVKS